MPCGVNSNIKDDENTTDRNKHSRAHTAVVYITSHFSSTFVTTRTCVCVMFPRVNRLTSAKYVSLGAARLGARTPSKGRDLWWGGECARFYK